MGILLVDYAIFFACFSFVGTIAGIYFFNWILQIYNRKSILLILITVVTLFEAMLLFILGVVHLSNDLKTGKHLTFVSFCEAIANKH